MDELAVLLVAWCLTREMVNGRTGCVTCSIVCPTSEVMSGQTGCYL